MKNLFLLSLILLPCILFSQRNLNMFDEYQYSYMYQQQRPYIPIDHSTIEKNHIKDLIYLQTGYNKKGKQQKGIHWLYEFDTSGLLTRYVKYNKKNEMLDKHFYTYNNSGKIVGIKNLNKKDQISSQSSYAFDELGNNIHLINYKKGKEHYEQINQFDSNRITQMLINRKGKYYQKWMYSYYENGSRETTNLYDKKNRLKFTWSYACLPSGEKIGKKRDTVNYCSLREHDTSGHLLYTKQRTDENGKIKKYISVYNADTVLLEYRILDHKDRLAYQRMYDSTEMISKIIRYRINGSIKDMYLLNRNGDGQLSNSNNLYFNRKGKLKSSWRAEFIYDKSNNLLSKTYFSEKNKPTYLYKLSYQFYQK